MAEYKTNIQVSNKLWKKLNDYKLKPSESFDEVITKLLKGSEAASKQPRENK